MDAMNFLLSIQPVPAICFAIGLLLLIVEMFHPGFGVPGITGLILLAVGVFLSARTFMEAMVLIVIILAILGVMLSFVINSAKKASFPKN
jgi:membrane-bound ClpP family serine protease